MPEAEGEAGVGAPTTHDATRRVEIRDSRETVINAFNSTYSIFESYPEDKLTPQQQAAKDLTKDIKTKTLDKGKASYLNRFESEDGEKFSQREYIPVDELILFLRERVKSGELTAEDETEYKELEKTLHKNSQEYYRGTAKKDYYRKMARITQESQRISSDPRLTKGNPHDDFLEAGRILFSRRELIIPPSPSEAPPPPPETEPAPEAETVLEPGPEPESPEQVRREFMIVNRTLDVQKRARELADEQLRNEMRRGNILNPLNWPRKIGLRIMEDFHRQKYIERASREMLANNNSYLSMDVVRNAAVDATHRLSEERQAGQAKIEQLRTDTLIENQQTVEVQGELRTTIVNEILRPVVERELTDQAQIQQRLREFVEAHQDDPQVQAVFGRDANQFGRLAEYFATDLLETGEAIRGDLEAHRYSLDELDNLVQVRLANTSWAAETQVRLNAVDRAIAWAERHRLTGTLINPATIGAGFSIGTFGLMRGLGFGARATQFIVPGAGLLPGALFAAARRNYDLKIDRASHQVERAYNMQIPQGARRREALEQLSYSTASVDEMINGGGQELLTGTDRQGFEELLSQDLSEGQTTNREAVARRVAEIQSRLDFSSREQVDLITYQAREQVEQGRLALINSIVRSTQTLRNSGMSDEEIEELDTRFTGEWNSRFIQNRQQQDRAFAHYRLRQAAGAAVFGGTVGLGAGFLVQQGIAETERAAGLSVGQTAIEKGIHKVTGLFGQHEQGGPPNIDHFKDLYVHGGNAELGNHMQAVINPADHSASIVDEATHQSIASGSIGPDGVLHDIVAGDGLSQDAAEQLKNGFSASGLASTIHETTTTSPSMLSAIQEAVLKHELTKSFHQKGLDIEINGVTNHVTIHDTLANATLEGQVSPDGTLTFGPIGNPNIDFAALHHDLAAAGFNVTETHQAVGAAGVDHLLSSSPSELQKQGIIETDMVRKSWNFHVLRSDIVAETGEHTHNELTLHIGQYLDENGRWVTDQKGILNFGGDIKGDLIPSNLPGVAPMHDQVLDQLITANGPIHHGDMVFVVDLNDGRQIMLGADNLGNTRLPQELFNPQTGEIHGVRSIASAVLEKDGNLLRSGSVLQEGTIPGGTTVHSLASVALETSSPQPIPVSAEIINAIPPSESVITHHFALDIIPPLHEAFEAPPIIPIPFAPRHPLERLFPPSIREVPPYYGAHTPYGSLSPETRDFYRSRLSERIRNDPSAVLDPETEAHDYLERQSPEYLAELNTYLSQEGMTEPMSDQSEAAVCIPVYALGEGQVVQNALEQYLLQIDSTQNKKAVDPSKFELILFLNYPRPQREELENRIGRSIAEGTEDRVKNGNPEPYDTEEVIRQFIVNHPELKIRVMKKEFDQRPQWGKIIKPLYDITLMRSLRRSIPSTKDISIITNDIDVIHMSPSYMQDILNVMKETQGRFDGMVGKIDMPNHGYEKYPGFLASMRLYQFLNSQIHHRGDRRVITQGRNSIIRSSIYAATGGVNQNTDAGADTELGAMIDYARNNPNAIGYLNRAWLHTDPRRELDMWLDGTPLPYAWDKWAAMDVYGNPWDSRLNISPQNPSRLDKDFLEREIYFEMERWGLTPNSKEIIRALNFLGLKPNDYHIGKRIINHPRGGEEEVETIIVDGLQGVIERLKNYIKEERWETTDRKIKRDLATDKSP